MSRVDLYKRLIQTVPGGALQDIATQNGWPSLAEMRLDQNEVANVALHVSKVGPHARKPHEFRFQNPGTNKPVNAPEDYLPLLVGLWDSAAGPPIFVVADGTSRLGRNTRFSILFDRAILELAAQSGWATYVSDTGEKIVALTPENFPLFVAACRKATGDGAALSALADDVAEQLSPHGLAPAVTVEEKGRRWANALRAVRSGAFSSQVLNAYSRKCAMCGLGDPLLQAAHILPVSAPGAQDIVSNGLALCANHHLLFDAHLLAIKSTTNEILRSPRLGELVQNNLAMNEFINNTFEKIAQPTNGQGLDPAMLNQRYAHFGDAYGWLPKD